MKTDSWLQLSEEVREARVERKPMVALESTIISHGMPFPQNLETARMLEEEVRKTGAVPATIAIMRGRVQVGLSPKDLELLATSRDVAKVSRRDMPLVMAKKQLGATTVAATMISAAMASIRVFATGGIGGVHRGGENSMDISADLTELSNSSVAVVCAGVKSILDMGRTLEYLETQGVPVLGYQTDVLPAFYTRESPHAIDARFENVQDLARTLFIKWSLGLEGGVLVANPVPESESMDAKVVNAAIEQALREAEEQGIKGKAITPFLLERVKQLTGGDSLKTNIALVRNNARLAGELAVALWSVDPLNRHPY